MPRTSLKTGTHGDQWLPTALDGAMIIDHTGHKHQIRTQEQSSAGNGYGI